MKLARHSFTLVELLVVVAVIGTLLLVAIPGVMRARANANEISAIASCRTIWNGAQAYYFNNKTFPSQMSDLTTTTPQYIDNSLGSGEKDGYTFTYTAPDSERFSVTANPKSVGTSGTRYFYVDQTGFIRVNASAEAGPSDPVLSQ